MTYVNSVQSRVTTVCGNRNSEQRADEGSAMLTVASGQRIWGCMHLSRVHALESQFNESGALVIGVQEGRAKEEQLRAGVYYQMVVAAASENGSYGVQAWFHKSLGPEFLAVNVVNPRLMAVAAKLSKLSAPSSNKRSDFENEKSISSFCCPHRNRCKRQSGLGDV